MADLLTLTEVAKKTKISMPTLQRYKKLYQDRIPSEGEGRKQRYPKAALPVFLQLKKENIGRRGRPRKNAAPVAKAAKAAKPRKVAKKAATRKSTRKPAAAKKATRSAKPAEGLLTLTQISKTTSISYPTLLRYVKSNLADIPHQGTGRARRYEPGAVAVFKNLRKRSKRGRKSKAALAAARAAAPVAAAKKPARRRGRPRKDVPMSEVVGRIKALEMSQRKLERLIVRLQKQLDKPIRLVAQRR